MNCETERGCDPILVIRAKVGAPQRTDPASPEEAQALDQPDELLEALIANKK